MIHFYLCNALGIVELMAVLYLKMHMYIAPKIANLQAHSRAAIFGGIRNAKESIT